MFQVTLLNYTPEARELLLFSKQTRLRMDAGLMEEIRQWPEERKQKELDYMLGTIESSWEFVSYVFSIEYVSRAFTHQFVRTREGAYAQQSQRTVDMTGFEYVVPDAFAGHEKFEQWYSTIMEYLNKDYQAFVSAGANPQDARAILPTNVATNIMAKFNLRTLSHMAEKRLCTRTQGEYQNVFRRMRELVLAVHPWADPFIRVACAKRGVCQFPNYAECPIKPGIFNPDTGSVWPGSFDNRERISVYSDATQAFGIKPLTKQEIQVRWLGTKFEAVPKQGEPTVPQPELPPAAKAWLNESTDGIAAAPVPMPTIPITHNYYDRDGAPIEHKVHLAKVRVPKHINCPCWTSGKFVRITGCPHHPVDL